MWKKRHWNRWPSIGARKTGTIGVSKRIRYLNIVPCDHVLDERHQFMGHNCVFCAWSHYFDWIVERWQHRSFSAECVSLFLFVTFVKTSSRYVSFAALSMIWNISFQTFYGSHPKRVFFSSGQMKAAHAKNVDDSDTAIVRERANEWMCRAKAHYRIARTITF